MTFSVPDSVVRPLIALQCRPDDVRMYKVPHKQLHFLPVVQDGQLTCQLCNLGVCSVILMFAPLLTQEHKPLMTGSLIAVIPRMCQSWHVAMSGDQCPEDVEFFGFFVCDNYG